MDTLLEILQVASNLSPLAVIGLLATVIFLMVKGKTSADEKVEHLAGNHLSCLPEIVAALNRIENVLACTIELARFLSRSFLAHHEFKFLGS